MAFPSKVRLRKITVDGVIYRWRAKMGEMESELNIYGQQSGRQILRIVSHDWLDIWVGQPFFNPTAPQNLTPAIVRSAIEFGLQNGWQRDTYAAPLVFRLENGEFSRSDSLFPKT